jgi:hypothetical protein
MKNHKNNGLPALSEGQDQDSHTSSDRVDMGMFDTANRWQHLREHHLAVGQSFRHAVIAGIEIVQLKLVLPHGKFAQAAKHELENIAPRTLSRYRLIGEWYLSATHGRVLTVAELREQNAAPLEDLCSDESVASYLESSAVRNADDLKLHAMQKVPALAKPASVPKKNRVENIMQKVRRSWSRMNPEQKMEFLQRVEDLQTVPSKAGSSDQAHPDVQDS